MDNLVFDAEVFLLTVDGLDNLVFDAEVFVEEKPDYYPFANETKKMTGEELFAQFASSLS